MKKILHVWLLLARAELEKQLDGLRLSRRVLMNLLEQVEKEKNELAQALERKNKTRNTVNHLYLNT
jgi:hypothetical protein